MGVARGAQVFSKAADDWLDESRLRGRAKARGGNRDDQRRRLREGPEPKLDSALAPPSLIPTNGFLLSCWYAGGVGPC